MPLTGDEFQLRDREAILSFLEAQLQNEYGTDIDLSNSSAFRTLAGAIAEVDAEDVEPAIQEVYNAAFLDTATGRNLENVVSILGISRRSATHATGVAEFRHGATTEATYTIDNGTTVQTSGTDPIQFETSDLVTLSFFDDFEDTSLDSAYIGDTADFSHVGSGTVTPSVGDQSLEGAAVSGSQIVDDTDRVSRGSVMDFRNRLPAGAIAGNLFGVVSADDYYRVKIDESGTHAIEIVTQTGGVTTLQSTATSVPTDEWLRNEIRWEGEESGRIISKIYDSSGTLVDELKVTGESAIDSGGYGFQSLDGTTTKYWDFSGERAVQANIRAVEGGPRGNVGAKTITEMPIVPSGVNSVTNPYPTGNDDFALTNTISLSVGQSREDDDELRERAQVSEGERGTSTVPAILSAISGLPQAESVSVYENKTNNDNTGTGGLPPKSFEVVYFGTDDDQTIAETIHEQRAFTSRDYGGAHGTAQSETITVENGQKFTINWSEPTELDVDMTLDIVVNDQYIGDDELRGRIVDYIGGVKPDGSSAVGTGSGEDVFVDQIEDIVTGPDDTGVIGISSKSFTPSSTTDSNGLAVVSVGSDEVASVDGTDGSISITTTQV